MHYCHALNLHRDFVQQRDFNQRSDLDWRRKVNRRRDLDRRQVALFFQPGTAITRALLGQQHVQQLVGLV